MNKNSPNNELGESKQTDANPDKNQTQEKENSTQEHSQLISSSTESVESGHSEPTTAVSSQNTEPKTNIVGRLRQLTQGVWHAPAESKSVAVNSLMTVLTFILALFAYGQWQVSKDSVTVAQKSLEVANATLKDARDSAKEASDRAERITKANESLSEAAKRQAEASAQIGKSSEASADAARRSAQTAENSFTIGERPWVMVRGANYTEIKAGESPAAVLTIVNTGNTPAFNVTTDTMIAFRNSPVPVPMPITPYTGEPRSKSSIAPKADMNILAVHKAIMTEEGIKELQGKGYRLYVWGKIEYDDIFKRRHVTEFCGVQRLGTLNFDLCDNNNTAK